MLQAPLRSIGPLICLVVGVVVLAPDRVFPGSVQSGHNELATRSGDSAGPSTFPAGTSAQTAATARQIRGQVRRHGQPMAKVAVHANGMAPAITDSNGRYSITLPAGWLGAIGPLAADHAFLPFQQNFLTESIDSRPVDFEALSMNPAGLQYYVAPDGIDRPGIPGTNANPWRTVEYALKQVGGGTTIVLKAGIYRQRVSVRQGGRPGWPTIIRAERKWAAIIDGSENHSLVTEPGSHWVIIDGIQTRRAGISGIKVYGDHTIVRNCWIHSSLRTGIQGHGTDGNIGVVDLRVENCLVERNGHVARPATGRGHGIYAHGDGLILRNNVFRGNAGHGIHLYQEGPPGVTGSTICNNLCYANGSRGILIDVTVDTPDARPNVIVNNTCIDNGHDGITVCSGFTTRPNIVANNICLGNHIKPGVLRPIGVYRLGGRRTGSPHVVLEGNICDADPRRCPDQVFDYVRYLNGNIVLQRVSFAGPSQGAFWPTSEDSPPGQGSIACLPLTDFWGRPQSDWKTAYRGAFPPVPPPLKDQGKPEYQDYWTRRTH